VSVTLHCTVIIRQEKSDRPKKPNLLSRNITVFRKKLQAAFWSASLVTRRRIFVWELQKPDCIANYPTGNIYNIIL